MNEKKCRDFLKLLFFQCLVDENFFWLCVKLGITPDRWPEENVFDEARLFFKQANEVSYGSAVLKSNIQDIPLEAHHGTIGEEEVKIFYGEYSRYLEAIALFKRISKQPEKASLFCEEFLSQKQTSVKYLSTDVALSNFITNQEFKIKNKIQNTKLSLFPIVSEAIDGFNHSRVGLITAETGFGKSQLAINILRSTMIDGHKSLYINMEMDTDDVVKRFLQSECNMHAYEFRSESYIPKIVHINQDKLKNTWITDGSSLGLSDIKSLISEIKRKHGLDFAIIDYDQKIEMEGYAIKDEWMALLKAIQVLEEVAKREKIHIILFAQSNSESNGRPIASKRTTQSASYVINFTEEEEKTIFKFIKNRHGPHKIKIELDYERSKSKITEIGLITEQKNILPEIKIKKGFKNPYAN